MSCHSPKTLSFFRVILEITNINLYRLQVLWFKLQIKAIETTMGDKSSQDTNKMMLFGIKALALFHLHLALNAVKCNLKELTTKSAWVPRSAVFSTRMLSGWLHQSCDSLACSIFPSCWVLSAIFLGFPQSFFLLCEQFDTVVVNFAIFRCFFCLFLRRFGSHASQHGEQPLGFA